MPPREPREEPGLKGRAPVRRKPCMSTLEVRQSMHVDIRGREPNVATLEVKETLHVDFRGKGNHACRL